VVEHGQCFRSKVETYTDRGANVPNAGLRELSNGWRRTGQALIGRVEHDDAARPTSVMIEARRYGGVAAISVGRSRFTHGRSI
jgi:hypothetical protein